MKGRANVSSLALVSLLQMEGLQGCGTTRMSETSMLCTHKIPSYYIIGILPYTNKSNYVHICYMMCQSTTDVNKNECSLYSMSVQVHRAKEACQKPVHIL